MVIGAPVLAATMALAAHGGSTVAQAAAVHALSAQALPYADEATLVGVAAPNAPLTISLSIDSQLAAKQAAVAAIYNPSSPSYHHYFSNATWDAAFSVPQATYDSVVTPLTALGMHVIYRDETRDLAELDATVAQADAAFAVTEQDWQLNGSGRVFYANDRAPTVAAGVDAVQGLTDVGFVMKGKPTDQANCQADPSGGQECIGSLEGSELRQVYNVGTTNIGAGQALAVNGDGDTQGPTADLHKYETDRSLPAVQTVFVNTDSDACVASGVQSTTCDTSGEGEWALDSTSSTAMAPGVGTLYYFFPSALGNPSGFQAWADYSSTANGPVPLQMNASWGECESFATTGSTIPVADGTFVTYTAAFVEGAGKGKTVFVSSGDQGGGCTLTGVNGVSNGGTPQIQWPCASEWVVCVGGTILYTNGQTGAGEQRANLNGTCTPVTAAGALNNCAEYGWTHTGGGTSKFRPAQTWQQALSPFPVSGRCTLDNDGNPVTPPGPVCRGAPDVAALSGDFTVAVADLAGNGVPGNGFNDVEGGSPQTATGGPTAGGETADGGTSLSDPLWEGMWADVQSSTSNPAGLGFAPPLLYSIGENPAEDMCAFYDVQIGSNGQNPAIPRESVDTTGWDYISGLGTPNIGCIESTLSPAAATNTPEAPAAALMLVLPAFAAAGFVIRRRRTA